MQLVQKVTQNQQERVRALEELRKLTDEFKSQREGEVETPQNLDKDKSKVQNLIAPEMDIPAGVGFRDYWNLLSFGPGAFLGCFLFFMTNIAKAVAQLFTSFTLANWTQ